MNAIVRYVPTADMGAPITGSNASPRSNNRVLTIQEAMSDLEDCARDLYQLALLSDEIQVRDQIDRCIHEYLAKAKWHSSVGGEKADLATVFEAISSATHANDSTVYVLHSLKAK
jgi:hypothetical protein